MILREYLEERESMSNLNAGRLDVRDPHEKLIKDALNDKTKLEVPRDYKLFVRIPLIMGARNREIQHYCPDIVGVGPGYEASLFLMKYTSHPAGRHRVLTDLRAQLIEIDRFIKTHFGTGVTVKGVYREGKPTKKEFDILNLEQLRFF